jgi:hypothetical protein
MEVRGNNRSVMPLDVLGRTRATLMHASSNYLKTPWLRGLGNLHNVHRAGDRLLQLLIFNEEFLVNASHQLALITSLPFVHTARRYYRLNGLVSFRDRCIAGQPMMHWELNQTCSFRGSKSRNKVSVGEPAEGSLTRLNNVYYTNQPREFNWIKLYPTWKREKLSIYTEWWVCLNFYMWKHVFWNIRCI